MKKYIIMLVLPILAFSASARDQRHDLPVINLVPGKTLLVHRSSNIEFSMTNYGKIGSEGGYIYDSETNTPAPSANFPKGSNIDYLFQGMIWIGAMVEDPNNPGMFDTLVSIGDDGWWQDIQELNPAEHGQVSMWRQSHIGDDEIYAEYYDTTISGISPDPNDERPHRPLGLKINQHSYCWSTPGYDEFFVIEYTLENIYDRDLHDVWFGIYYEGDVMHISENGYGYEEGAQDDLCGFVEHSGRGIGWLADNNGQPYNGVFTDSSGTGVMGLMLLGSSTPYLENNFNWWICNINSHFDWGPRLRFHDDGPYPGGGYGTPGGDIGKYKIMSRSERDYDQAYSALDWTHNGWIRNLAQNPSDFADGYDTRFLLSFGSFELNSGDAETLTVAYFAGHDFHTDPNNFADNLQGHTDDSTSIARFYDNLNFADFLGKADTALYYYNSGLGNIPIGPPADFKVLNWSANHATLSWSPRQHPRLTEYRIYRGTQPGIYDPQKITPDNFTDTSFVDIDVADNTIYYYMMKSANSLSIEGGGSPEINVNTGRPLTPSGLAAASGNNQVELTWESNPEDDIAGYIIYRNSYYGPDSILQAIDSCTVLNYLDLNLVNGRLYRYSIRALDTFGNVSFFSDTVSAIPHNSDSGLLLINANTPFYELNPDYDSMMVFYDRLMENTSEPFTIINYPPQYLLELANYRTVVWCADLIHNDFYFIGREELFADYLDAGGNLILAGPKLTMTISFDGLYDFVSNEFGSRYLNLDAVEYPDFLSSEFTGGIANSAGYPDFNVDTSRANRIIFPSDNNDGRLFGLGAFIPRDLAEVIYNFRAVNPDTSNYDGRPIAAIHHDENFNTAVLDFPFYYVEPPVANDIFSMILQQIQATDIDEYSDHALPEKTLLLQNFPNPFNANTNIKYELNAPTDVTITVFDILGRKVDDIFSGRQQAGFQSIAWRADNLPSGVYFYKIQAGDYTAIRKCALLK